jgi:hypothetical protein
VNTNQAIAASLQKNPLFAFDPVFHQKEHCIEVQLPFLQYIFKDKISVVPVLLGTNDPLICRKLAQILKPYFRPENLFVISTDFSHYPSSEDALKIDNQVAASIVTNNPDQFFQTISSFGYNKISGLATACCSWGSVLTLLYLTENDNDIGFRKVLYRNSGDSGYGDTKQVVGYYALVAEKSSGRVFELSENEKIKLLEIARNAIKFHLAGNPILDDEGENLPDVLRENCGAFVTLKVEGHLRGCIGTFESHKPLHKTIAEMAIASASRDYRFSPLTEKELAELNISISVLSALQKITDISLIRLGVDGIYIRKGNRSGTFLPEVATETGWNLHELLGHCARDKAGIGWEGWKDEQTELFIYQSVNFSG